MGNECALAMLGSDRRSSLCAALHGGGGWGWAVYVDRCTLTPCSPMSLIHSITAPPSLT